MTRLSLETLNQKVEADRKRWNMGIRKGWEKLFAACRDAVARTDTPQKRLASIVQNHLNGLQREHVPDGYAWNGLQLLIEASTVSVTERGEQHDKTDTSFMSDEDATKCLHFVVSLFGDVAEAYDSRMGPEIRSMSAAAGTSSSGGPRS
jgi:hypothetical protein